MTSLVKVLGYNFDLHALTFDPSKRGVLISPNFFKMYLGIYLYSVRIWLWGFNRFWRYILN